MKEEYIEKQINNDFKCDLTHMTNNIKNNKRVIFTKFGDGEYNCMNHHNGNNCDGDKYTNELGDELKKSFISLSLLSKNEDGIYLGKWHSEVNTIIKYYADIFYDYLEKNNIELLDIPFVDYHFCYNEHKYFGNNNNMYEFVKSIQDVDKYKIIVSNNLNKRLMTIFKGNNFAEIPENSWYANGLYDVLYGVLFKELSYYNDGIVILSAGLATKVLINELSSIFPNASFIDIGSGFDLLARKKPTRIYYDCISHSYEDELSYYKGLLPIEFI